MATILMLDTNDNTEEKNNSSKEVTISRKRGRPKKTIDETDAKQKRDARLKAKREETAKRRKEETPEEIKKRLESDRERAKKRRKEETPEEQNKRLIADREQAKKRRLEETVLERQNRLADQRPRSKTQKLSGWRDMRLLALDYDPGIEYESIPILQIGSMTERCRFCDALKWKNEPPGICCSNGKVKLEKLPDIPEPLYGLLTGTDSRSKDFLAHIRKYNSAFQMTSFGADIVKEGNFMPTFKVLGQVCHLFGSYLPTDDVHKFLQVYFTESYQEELQQRCKIIPDIKPDIIDDLQTMLHKLNSFVKQFKMAKETMGQEQLSIVIHEKRVPTKDHPGRYNAPTVNEVAVLMVGQQCEKRDIIIRSRDDKLQRISEIHPSYDALQYPLILHHGTDSYNIYIQEFDPVKNVFTKKKVSAMDFYRYRMMIRPDQLNSLLMFRQLSNQYWVDMGAKMITERLNFIRNSQKQLRVDSYIHLKDSTVNDGNPAEMGQLVILPSSFTGGPRYMHEKTQDAMAYTRLHGGPDLFITYTTNQIWDEIKEALYPGQAPSDRHDIISRVFKLKLKMLIDLLTKGEAFGEVRCYMYSVEWQKRGLPHAHILLWLKNKLSPNDIDKFICAEIPDPESDPKLYEIIKTSMIHGPCGFHNTKSPCMDNGKCTKKYPRPFVRETQTGKDGYPTYRRRSTTDGGISFELHKKNGNIINVDNSWVVPYNPTLSRIFRAHINVEYCSSVKAIQYVCKYINKGCDQATFTKESKNRDEVFKYESGRYLSTAEATWRILGYGIHEHYPAVEHLEVHLENGERVYFKPTDNLADRLMAPPKTTLTGFFDLCKEEPFARTLLYQEVTSYYRWDKSKRQFVRRIQGNPVPGYPEIRRGEAIGRVYTIHPSLSECFFLRMLLFKIRGPTSFESLKQGQPTFQAACRAMGLLEEDTHWEETISEAAVSESPSKLRDLFVIMLTCCYVSDAKTLWEKFKDDFTADILYRRQCQFPQAEIQYSEDIYNEGLICIEDKVLASSGKLLTTFGLPEPQRSVGQTFGTEYTRETLYNVEEQLDLVTENEPKLTNEQRKVYNEILESVDQSSGNVYFLNADAGTGKSFCINLTAAKIRSEGKIAVAVASSGIAATLLNGGRTAHSTFKLPLNLVFSENPVCNIKKGSSLAKLLQDCSIIFWDECTMSHKGAIEALDRTLKDLRNSDKVMGGVTVVLSGDFRQTLPVIQRGTRADEVNASIQQSSVWKHVKVLSLTKNMRAHLYGDESAAQFSKILLDIGEGKLKETDGEIEITRNIGNTWNTSEELIAAVYDDVSLLHTRSDEWICERAIVTPTNEQTIPINDYLTDQLPGESKIYDSIDTAITDEGSVQYPTEFLNAQTPSGMPPHRLKLRVGVPIMLLRNLDAPHLCNGTRLRVTNLKPHLIEATILTGISKGKSVFIPRIPLIPNDCPFQFKRLQFPVRVCYAITINKAQGQTLKIAGVDLRHPCFSHGQLYVAFSRVSSSKNLHILTPNGRTRNVVYKEALLGG